MNRAHPNENGHRGPSAPDVHLLSSAEGEVTQVLLAEAGYETPYSSKPLAAIRQTYEQHGIEVFVFRNQLATGRKGLARTPGRSPIDLDDPLVVEFLRRGRSGTISAKIDPYLILKDLNAIQEKNFPIVQSEWVQDSFGVKTGPEGWGIILQPILASRPGDQFLADELTLHPDLRMLIQKTELKFEGGNILTGNDFALVGKNTLAVNWIDRLKQTQEADLGELNEEFDRLNAQFARTLGVRELIWVGFDSPRLDLFDQSRLSFQPDYHLDLFLTLGGRSDSGSELIFIADPRMGQKIAEAATSEEVDHGLQWDGEAISNSLIAQQFDDLERFFATYNLQAQTQFEVVRLPMLIHAGIVYSFNNAIVDMTDHGKRVFVPNYCEDLSDPGGKGKLTRTLNDQLQAVSAAVKEAFHGAGFGQVIFTGDGALMKNYARRRGSLHCLTKVLRRRIP
ncbi:MAG: hypothetical protein AAGN35_23345 [Bacteroidota bacterium]